MYFEQGQFNAAIIEARTALQKNPGHEAATILLSRVYLELGLAAQSINLLEAIDGTSQDYFELLTESYIERGKYGSALLLVSVAVALSGESFGHFLAGLFLLGVGWNFAFTGGTVLLTEVHTASERAKVQGLNDFILFSGLAISSLSAGMIFHYFGWMWVNLATAPLILAVLLPAIWLRAIRKKEQAAAFFTESR